VQFLHFLVQFVGKFMNFARGLFKLLYPLGNELSFLVEFRDVNATEFLSFPAAPRIPLPPWLATDCGAPKRSHD